jgi:hypothetical protein
MDILIILLSIIFMHYYYDKFMNIVNYADNIIIDYIHEFKNNIIKYNILLILLSIIMVNLWIQSIILIIYRLYSCIYYDKFMNIIKNIDNISIMIFMYIDEFMIIIKINYIDNISI